MLRLAQVGSRTIFSVVAVLFLGHLVLADEKIASKWFWWLLIVLVLSGLIAVLTSDTARQLAERGPRLVGGELVETTRNARGGLLQIIGVEIYNERESGGEPKTARGVVPTLEALDRAGNLATKCRGVWFPDLEGGTPQTVDFRPTHEAHPVELVAKFPDDADAWLAGRDRADLKPGDHEICVMLRGDNMKPTRLTFWARNPGRGGRLAVRRKASELPDIATDAAASPLVVAAAPALTAEAPPPSVPTPPPGAQLDAWIVPGSSSGTFRLTVKNVGDAPIERIEWIFPESVTNWHVFLDSLATYPIPVLDPDDEQTALVAITFGGPPAVEITLRGWVGEAEYTRKRALSVAG